MSKSCVLPASQTGMYNTGMIEISQLSLEIYYLAIRVDYKHLKEKRYLKDLKSRSI